MVISMQQVIQDPDTRAQVIEDTAKLVDEEVKRKKGFGGAAIKTGYSVVKRLHKGRFIQDVVNKLLDEFIDALEPIHAEYRDEGAPGTFDERLVKEQDRATQALLAVTDGKAENAEKKVVRKTYAKLRPRAEKHVMEALPGLGRMVDSYTRD